MSNPFPKGVRFFPVPEAVGDMLAKMGQSELLLYLALCLIAQRHTAVELHLPAYLLHDYTELHPETIPVARRKLEGHGLIKSRKGFNGVTIYTLLNPVTHAELPAPVFGKQKFSGVYIYKEEGRSARTVRKLRSKQAQAQKQPDPPTGWNEIGNQTPIKSVSTEGPTPIESVSTPDQNRGRLTDSADSGFAQTNEKTEGNANQKSLSEETLKKEFSGKGFAVSESLPSSQTERIPVPKQKAEVKEEVKDESVSVRMMREPVIQRLVENFSARIATSPDADVDNVGLPYDEWMKREVSKQLGPGLPYWPKRNGTIYKQHNKGTSALD
jgi:hypothetical protein